MDGNPRYITIWYRDTNVSDRWKSSLKNRIGWYQICGIKLEYKNQDLHECNLIYAELTIVIQIVGKNIYSTTYENHGGTLNWYETC